jgi:hypothetical protein
VHHLARYELGDGEGDDLGRTVDVGDHAARFRSGEATEIGAQTQLDLGSHQCNRPCQLRKIINLAADVLGAHAGPQTLDRNCRSRVRHMAPPAGRTQPASSCQARLLIAPCLAVNGGKF